MSVWRPPLCADQNEAKKKEVFAIMAQRNIHPSTDSSFMVQSWKTAFVASLAR